MKDCREIVESAIHGFRGGVAVREQPDGSCTVTAPFVTVGGDPVHVYVMRQGDDLVLSDEGEILGRVFSYNLKRERENARYIQDIARTFRIYEEAGALLRTTSKSDLGSALLEFINALQLVAGLEVRKRMQTVQRFEVTVRFQLRADRAPIDASWFPEFLGKAGRTDFASVDHTRVFAALGTVRHGEGEMIRHAKQKLFGYYMLQDQRYAADSRGITPIAIFDETKSWPREVMELIDHLADARFAWPSEKEEVKSILVEHGEPAGGLDWQPDE